MKKAVTLVTSMILISFIAVVTIIFNPTTTSSHTKSSVVSPNTTKAPNKKQKPDKKDIDIYTYIVPNIGCTQIEYNAFTKINEYREKNGVEKLEWSKALYVDTTIRAKEISQKFSHTRPNGTPFFTVSNISTAENISAGHSNADKTVEGWIDSKGHRENILSKNIKYAAISLYRTNTNYKYYWVNLFK